MRNSSIFITTLLASTAVSSAKDHEFTVGDSTYILVERGASWNSAKSKASRMTKNSVKGRLAVINSEEENKAIFAELKKLKLKTTAPDGGGAVYVWLGGSDKKKEGDFRWVTGELISEGYKNYGAANGKSEPDNWGKGQDALAMGLTAWPVGKPSQWNDLNDRNKLPFLVEFSKTE